MKDAFTAWPIWLPLYLLLAVASGFVDLRVRAHPENAVNVYMPQVVDGTADAPGRYRVLIPFANDVIVRATGAAPMNVFLLTRLLWFALAFVALHVYLRTWFAPAAAMTGTILTAALIPLTYTNSWPHPDHIPELALFTLACLAVARQHDGWFAAALVVASLNRETSAFLVLVYAVTRPFSRAHAMRTAGFAAVWALIFVGLRLWRGWEPYDMWQLGRNIEFLKLLPPPYDPYYRAYAWFGIALTVPLLYLALRSRRRQPVFVRRILLVVPVVFVVALAISSIIESRIFTPVLPILLPALMFTVATPKSVEEGPLPSSRQPEHESVP